MVVAAVVAQVVVAAVVAEVVVTTVIAATADIAAMQNEVLDIHD